MRCAGATSKKYSCVLCSDLSKKVPLDIRAGCSFPYHDVLYMTQYDLMETALDVQ